MPVPRWAGSTASPSSRYPAARSCVDGPVPELQVSIGMLGHLPKDRPRLSLDLVEVDTVIRREQDRDPTASPTHQTSPSLIMPSNHTPSQGLSRCSRSSPAPKIQIQTGSSRSGRTEASTTVSSMSMVAWLIVWDIANHTNWRDSWTTWSTATRMGSGQVVTSITRLRRHRPGVALGGAGGVPR